MFDQDLAWGVGLSALALKACPGLRPRDEGPQAGRRVTCLTPRLTRRRTHVTANPGDQETRVQEGASPKPPLQLEEEHQPSHLIFFCRGSPSRLARGIPMASKPQEQRRPSPGVGRVSRWLSSGHMTIPDPF